MRIKESGGEKSRILIGSCLIILGAFLYALLAAPQASDDRQAVYPGLATKEDIPSKILNIYSINGNVKNIDGNIVYFETFTLDSIDKPVEQKKLEIRKLEIGGATKFVRWNFTPIKGAKPAMKESRLEELKFSDYEIEIKNSRFEDLKIGDSISAEYPYNLAKIRDFEPSVVTILPYAAY